MGQLGNNVWKTNDVLEPWKLLYEYVENEKKMA